MMKTIKYNEFKKKSINENHPSIYRASKEYEEENTDTENVDGAVKDTISTGETEIAPETKPAETTETAPVLDSGNNENITDDDAKDMLAIITTFLTAYSSGLKTESQKTNKLTNTQKANLAKIKEILVGV